MWATIPKKPISRGVISAFGIAVLSASLAACVQSSGTNTRASQPLPTAATAAKSDPLVLSGVSYTQGDAMTASSVQSAAPTSSDIVAGAPNPAVTSTPLAPVATTSANPPVYTAPVSGAPEVQMATSPGETAEFPNINVTPPQPQGKLLTPEERAKLIQELNALAGTPGGQ